LASPEADSIPVLDVRNLTVHNDRGGTAVRNVSLHVAPGEILGVAGVDGSGQKELAQAIAGLRMQTRGEIYIGGKEVSRHSAAKRRDEGVAYIPEDRHREGLILDFTVAENMLLGKQRDPLFGGGRLLDLSKVVSNGEAAIRNHNIRAPGANVSARALSGGNQQKIVVARALESNPKLLVAMQPTRGLDVAATDFIYSQIRRALDNGIGVLFFSLDMDEIMELSHRIAVIFNGEIPAVLRRQDATADSVGRIMLEGRA
jgi:simple sugar transport system ATP-binding protein